MTMRDKLLADMNSFITESKWEEYLQDLITQCLEVRPTNPYLYFQKKISLKQKFDNSKNSLFLVELTMFITHTHPLTVSKEAFRNKVTYLCVEKYQHTKIKRSELINFINVILMSLQAKQKEHFVKLMEQLLDKQFYPILAYCDLLYETILYNSMICQLGSLQQKLSYVQETITKDIFKQYLNTVNPKTSIIKATGIEIETEGDFYKIIAHQIVHQIEI